MIKRFFPTLALLAVSPLVAHAEDIVSPNKKTTLSLTLKDGLPHWTASYHGKPIIHKSHIDVRAPKSLIFDSSKFSQSAKRGSYKPAWGQQSKISNNYTHCMWELSKGGVSDLKIEARVYNNAIALRYHYSPKLLGNKIHDQTHLRFKGDHTFWASNGEKPNIGPVKLSEWEKGKRLQQPVTLKLKNNLYVAVIEAGIYNQYPFSLHKKGGNHYYTSNTPSQLGTFSGRPHSSWRVLSIAKKPGHLVTSSILSNLNPPSKIADTSWIKPGFTLWDWRAWGATAPDGFVYDLDMKSWRRFIDFAATKENVRYLMLDANWYGPEFDPEMDPTKSRDHLLFQQEDGHIVRAPAPDNWEEPIDVPGLIKYAKEKGVGIILYINDKARIKYDFENTLATYQKWGAAGIKYGFMATNGDKKVAHTREIVRLCAKYKLICDFHDGPIPGSGDERTYPNYVTREYCHAQSDAKRAFGPRHFVTTMYVNGLTGSLDMANGLYAIKGAKKVRPRIFEKVNTTVVAETARTLISFAAVSILPDIPEAYEAKADLFTFIEKMPLTWDESHVISGEIGSHISTARRSGDQWFIGTACNEKGGTFPINFNFLEKGATYKATVYADTLDTHFETNPESYKIFETTYKKGDVLMAQLAPGGGHCVLLEKQ